MRMDVGKLQWMDTHDTVRKNTPFFLFVYSHVHTLFGPFLPSIPCPLSLPLPTLSLPGRVCSALISNFVEEKA
jgi:hypothetical protein